MDAMRRFGFNRRMYYFAHHRKALSDELVRRVIRECGPETNASGQPYSEEDRRRWLHILKEEDFVNHILTWDYPFLYPVQGGVREERMPAPLFLRQTSHVVSMSRTMSVPVMVRDSRHWISVKTNSPAVNCTTDYGVEWFFDRVRPTIPIFEPDFAFADNDLGVARNLDGKDVEPKSLAWPLMIFGPKEVQRIGKAKLMGAPAWKVAELAYGGVWLQVAENPFIVKSKDLKPLAKHLELEPRSLRE